MSNMKISIAISCSWVTLNIKESLCNGLLMANLSWVTLNIHKCANQFHRLIYLLHLQNHKILFLLTTFNTISKNRATKRLNTKRRNV